MLEVANLCVAIDGVEILREFSMTVRDGEMIAVTGRNGAGKTTLIRAVMGLLRVRSGCISVAGQDFTRRRPHERAAAGIGYMPEDRGLIGQFTVHENILLPRWALRRPDLEDRYRQICEWIPEIAAMRDRRASSLSGGQQKLVALARALIPARELLLLDEPFEGVSPSLSQRLAAVLAGIDRKRLAIVISQSEEKHARDLLTGECRIERGANA